MPQTPPHIAYLFRAVLALTLMSPACRGEFEEPIECSDLCDNCDQPVFDFDHYTATCDATESLDFCGLPDATAHCTEPDFNLEETTIAEIHHALLSGQISCQWLTQRYFDRILWHDLKMTGPNPPLNAFVHLNEAALQTAGRLDEFHRCEGELAGPMHCVPFVIKDNYASLEVPITAGSLGLIEARPTFDAFTVRRLRESGAIMVGSTAMDELARGVHGLSGRSGKTGNAYNTRYNSGGSSSGAAVAVSTNMAVGGLGTDNCSSLMNPASYNGLFSMRSSIGLVSTDGVYPSNRLDAVAGPMTRTATDLAKFFDILSDFNPEDHRHCEEAMPRQSSYTDYLSPDGLRGKRIGILRSLGEDNRRPFDGSSAPATEFFESTFDALESLGVELVDGITLPELDTDRKSSGQGVDVNRFLERTEHGVSSYQEFCEDQFYSHWLFETVDDCMDRATQSEGNLRRRIENGEEAYGINRDYVHQVLDENHLDALFYPADTRGSAGIRARSNNCILPSITGLPTLVVPAGMDDGLPVGMVFTARLFDEATLFEIAYGYEQATFHRQPPPMSSEATGPPPLDPQTFNDIHLQMGITAFAEVLRDQDKFNLTAEVFADITKDILLDNDLSILIE